MPVLHFTISTISVSLSLPYIRVWEAIRMDDFLFKNNTTKYKYARNKLKGNSVPLSNPPTLLKCEPYNDVLRKRNTFYMGYKRGYWNCQGFNLKSLCCLVNRFKALRLIERYQPKCLHYHYIGQMILLRFSTLNTSCVVRFCRKWPDTTVAVPSGAPIGQFQRQLHHLGGNQWRVQDDRPWWSR